MTELKAQTLNLLIAIDKLRREKLISKNLGF